jgi:hypothetical protein
VEYILRDSTGSYADNINRGFNLVLHLLLQEVPGVLTYLYEITLIRCD